MTTLLVQLPSGSAHFHQISEDHVVLGRSRTAGIQVAARGVSRRHCQISQVQGRCVLEDLDSKNGVYLNDERVRRAVLKNNDCIVIGEARVYFYTEASVDLGGKKHREPAPTPDSKPESHVCWVDSPSEIVSRTSGGALKTYDPRSGKASPSPPRPSAEPAGGSGGPSARERTLDLRIRALESTGYVSSFNQLFERAAELLFGELKLRRVMVLRNTLTDVIEPVYLRTSVPSESLSAAAAGDQVLFSRGAIERVRREMRPLAFHLGGPDEMAELRPDRGPDKDGTAPYSLVAPIVCQGHWFGALQIDCPPAAEAPDVWAEEALAEVCDVVSHGIGCLQAQQADAESIDLVDAPSSMRAIESGQMALATMSLRDHQPQEVCIMLVRLGLNEAGWPSDEMSERLLAVRDGRNLVGSAIEDAGGTLERSLGNTLLASFSARDSPADALNTASEAAINTLLAFVDWNRERRESGRSRLETSVVLSTGHVLRDNANSGAHEGLGLIGPPIEEVTTIVGFVRDGQIILAPSAIATAAAGVRQDLEDWRGPDNADAKDLLDGYKELCWKGRSRFSLG